MPLCLSFTRAISLKYITSSTNGAIAVWFVICLWWQLLIVKPGTYQVSKAQLSLFVHMHWMVVQSITEVFAGKRPEGHQLSQNANIFLVLYNLRTTFIYLTSCSSSDPDSWYYYYKTCFGEGNTINNSKIVVSDCYGWSPLYSWLLFLHLYSFTYSTNIYWLLGAGDKMVRENRCVCFQESDSPL